MNDKDILEFRFDLAVLYMKKTITKTVSAVRHIAKPQKTFIREPSADREDNFQEEDLIGFTLTKIICFISKLFSISHQIRENYGVWELFQTRIENY